MSNGAHELTAEDLGAVRRTWEAALAANTAADLDTLEKYLADDHISLDPRITGPLRGSRAWREWAESVDFGDVDLDVEVEALSGSGDLAYVVWTASGGWTEGGEKVETSAKGISLFRRGADGSWQWSHNAWNANP